MKDKREKQKIDLLTFAKELGFVRLGVSSSEKSQRLPFFKKWLEKGYNAEMKFLARPDRIIRREDMNNILKDVSTVISFVLPYGLSVEKLKNNKISCFSWGQDYHEIILDKLSVLCTFIEKEWGAKTCCFTDTGAIFERDLAEKSGLGFIGKNSMIIHPKEGSFFFLGQILTTVEIEPDVSTKMPECGSCSKCMESCPAGAIVNPYEVDARRCVSYLTIENKGPIPQEVRKLIGTRIFGCDTCQVVCPWNRFEKSEDSLLFGEVENHFCDPDLLELMVLSEHDFDKLYKGSPIFRIGRMRLLRNVAVALGNSGKYSDIKTLEKVKSSCSDLVIEHIDWAIEEISKREKQ